MAKRSTARRALMLLVATSAVVFAFFFYFAWQTAAETTRHTLQPKNRGFDAPDVPDDVDHQFVVERGGVELNVWVLDPRGVRPEGGVDAVVVLHGIADQKRTMYGLARRYSLGGLRSVLVDFRGHGLSSSVPLTFGAEDTADLSAVLDAMDARGMGVENVGVYGPSYGGGIALQWSGTDTRVQRVLSASGFASLAKLQVSFLRVYEPVEFTPPEWFARAVTDSVTPFDVDDASGLRLVPEGNAQIVLTHSTNDEVVPYDNAQAIVDVCGERCRLVTLEGMNHLESMSNLPLRQESYKLMTGEDYPGEGVLNARYRAWLAARER
ncbi:MAG: alpha/beta fold hydrolase [Myxococcota bacterium]